MEISIAIISVLIYALYTKKPEPLLIPDTPVSDIELATKACESSMLKKYEKGALYFECEKIK